MSMYRVSMEFDLEIADEAAAKRMAADYFFSIARETEAMGGTVITSGGVSPEVSAHEMAEHMQATVTAVAMQALGRGADTMPWLTLSNAVVNNEPISS